MNDLIIKNKLSIKNFLESKNIKIEDIDSYFDKMEFEIGPKKEYPYAKISKENSYKIIISEDIPVNDRYKWINHEMIHVISNNLPTVNDTNVGGIIVEKDNLWIGQYLNEAITEYINQSIINCKYSNYYDKYIDELLKLISIIGENIILKSYFTNNLSLIINELMMKLKINKEAVLNYLDYIDNLNDESLKDNFFKGKSRY